MGQPNDTRIEAANAVAETLRQHRNHAVREIDAVSPPGRFPVECAPRSYVSRDIGDMHCQFPLPIGQSLDVDCIIKIPSVIGIDGHDKFLSQIFAL